MSPEFIEAAIHEFEEAVVFAWFRFDNEPHARMNYLRGLEVFLPHFLAEDYNLIFNIAAYLAFDFEGQS